MGSRRIGEEDEELSSSSPPLASAYPVRTPPALVGEAVRSALRSKQRCLVYDNFAGSPLEFGLVEIRGTGTRPFLHSKLTRSFLQLPSLPSPATSSLSFASACLLDTKGRVVDLVRVAVVDGAAAVDDDADHAGAFVLTGPGHSSTELFRRLDPFVFPLDQVILTDRKDDVHIFTLASIDWDSVHAIYDRVLRPEILSCCVNVRSSAIDLPDRGAVTLLAASMVRTHANPSSSSSSSTDNAPPQEQSASPRISLLIVPCTQLPECAAVGYTFCLWCDREKEDGSDSAAKAMGMRLWNKLLDDPDGPVHLGPSEFEALRIEAGSPRRGTEFTGGRKKLEDQDDDNADSDSVPKNNGRAAGGRKRATTAAATITTPANPLELHLDQFVDLDKGCYLGQEGVASVAKNPRGPPRLLYQVVFDDEFNHYGESDDCRYDDDHDDVQDDENLDNNDKGSTSSGDNFTRAPRPGDELFALGSNQEIPVGTVTSMAAPGATGEPTTVGLAVVRRADSIIKAMKSRGLELPERVDTNKDSSSHSSNASSSPSRRRALPLEGLEVIVSGTYTIGRLQTVPTIQYRPNENMFMNAPAADESTSSMEVSPMVLDDATEEDVEHPTQDPWESVTIFSSVKGGTGDASTSCDITEEARAAAEAEARRKEEKMELLRRRADEVMARRKKKNNVDK